MSIKRSNQHQHPSRWGATREHLVAVCSCNCIFKYICMRPTAEFRQETRNLYNLFMMLAFLVTCRLGRLYNQKHQRHGNGIRRLTWLYASPVACSVANVFEQCEHSKAAAMARGRLCLAGDVHFRFVSGVFGLCRSFWCSSRLQLQQESWQQAKAC